jgi:hypothetical protein
MGSMVKVHASPQPVSHFNATTIKNVPTLLGPVGNFGISVDFANGGHRGCRHAGSIGIAVGEQTSDRSKPKYPAIS